MAQNSAIWDQIETFLRADDWTPTRGTGHEFFEKLLPSRELLRTHVSRSRHKTLSAGRFRAILRNQLHVSETDFWDAVRTGKPVVRPAQTDEPSPQHPAWVVRVLVNELHLSSPQIEALSLKDAIRLVDEHHSRPQNE